LRMRGAIKDSRQTTPPSPAADQERTSAGPRSLSTLRPRL